MQRANAVATCRAFDCSNGINSLRILQIENVSAHYGVCHIRVSAIAAATVVSDETPSQLVPVNLSNQQVPDHIAMHCAAPQRHVGLP